MVQSPRALPYLAVWPWKSEFWLLHDLIKNLRAVCRGCGSALHTHPAYGSWWPSWVLPGSRFCHRCTWGMKGAAWFLVHGGCYWCWPSALQFSARSRVIGGWKQVQYPVSHSSSEFMKTKFINNCSHCKKIASLKVLKSFSQRFVVDSWPRHLGKPLA